MRKLTKQVTINGTNTEVEVRDSDSDTTWVFLHGWGSKKEVWRQAVKNFSETSVTVDLPGFGNADDLVEPWNIDNYKKAIKDLIKKLDLQNVVLVGHSFGGQIAASVAADRPEWMRGLVLVNAAVVRSKKPKSLSAIGSFLSPLFQLPGVKKLRPVMYRLIGVNMPPEDDNLRQTMRNILREDQTSNLSKIKIPTLAVWGDKDTDTPWEEVKPAVNNIQNVTVSILDGGHYIFIDAPDAFQRKLVDFQEDLNETQS